MSACAGLFSDVLYSSILSMGYNKIQIAEFQKNDFLLIPQLIFPLFVDNRCEIPIKIILLKRAVCQESPFADSCPTASSGPRSLRLLLGIKPLLEDDPHKNGDDDDGEDGDHEHHEEDIVLDVGKGRKDHDKGSGGIPETGPERKVLPCILLEPPDQVGDAKSGKREDNGHNDRKGT